jgi:hypothetical protein
MHLAWNDGERGGGAAHPADMRRPEMREEQQAVVLYCLAQRTTPDGTGLGSLLADAADGIGVRHLDRVVKDVGGGGKVAPFAGSQGTWPGRLLGRKRGPNRGSAARRWQVGHAIRDSSRSRGWSSQLKDALRILEAYGVTLNFAQRRRLDKPGALVAVFQRVVDREQHAV